MATITLRPASGTGSTFDSGNGTWAATGDADIAACIQEASDGKTLNGAGPDRGGVPNAFCGSLNFNIEDPGAVLFPLSITISDVQVVINHTGSSQFFAPGTTVQTDFSHGGLLASDFSGVGNAVNLVDWRNAVAQSTAMATDPTNGLAWTREALVEGYWAITPAYDGHPLVLDVFDRFSLVVNYTAAISISPPSGAVRRVVTVTGTFDPDNLPTVTLGGVPVDHLQVVTDQLTFEVPSGAGPGIVNLDIDGSTVGTFDIVAEWFWIEDLGLYDFAIDPLDLTFPLFPFTIYRWRIITTPIFPERGWWVSLDEEYQGASLMLLNSRPKDPRGYLEF